MIGDEFQRRNQVNISEGKIEDKARTQGAKCLRIEGKAQTDRDREGKRSGEGIQRATPQKICEIQLETLQAIWCTVFSNFIDFFFDERGDCGQASEGEDLSRAECRGVVWVPLKRCANSKIKRYLVECFLFGYDVVVVFIFNMACEQSINLVDTYVIHSVFSNYID